MIKDIGYRRLVDEVAEQLRAKIYAGEYVPGDHLRQEHLAATLEVSRTPLREALRVLERDKLLTVLPGGRIQVANSDLPNLLAAYELREVVDGLAARLAARRRPVGLADQLARLLEAQQQVLVDWHPSSWIHANVAFHRLIFEESANDYVLTLLPLVHMTVQVFKPVGVLEPSRAQAALEEHRAIAAAIVAGDPAAAQAAAQRHIRRTIDAIEAESARNSPTPDRDRVHQGESRPDQTRR
jgi:DNA-binding GntR family transcriptional regulator